MYSTRITRCCAKFVRSCGKVPKRSPESLVTGSRPMLQLLPICSQLSFACLTCSSKYRQKSSDGAPDTEETQTWDDLRVNQSESSTGVFNLDEAVEFLREEGALDIVVIKIPETMCYVDYFIIATATSPRHLGSIAEMMNKFYKKKRKPGQPFTIIEGKRVTDDWQCLDFGNMVVHIMLEETRSHYDLEKLWVLGPKYDDMLQETPSDEEILKRLSMEGLNLMSMSEDTVKALGNLDIDNPWINDPGDVYNKNDEGFDDTFVDDTARKKDELEDDDAFLV